MPERRITTHSPVLSFPRHLFTGCAALLLIACNLSYQGVASRGDAPTQIPTGSPTLPATQETAFEVGIQVQPSPDFNLDAQRLWMNDATGALGMNWIKQQVRWELLEPTQGQIDWAVLDFTLPLAAEYGARVMLSIVTAPAWARDSAERHGPPANYDDYAAMVAAIVQRYPGRIHAIEVWNEQNLDREWTTVRGLSAVDYVELFRRTSAAVKAVDPNILMISGALSPGGGYILPDGTPAAMEDFQYMQDMIDAGLLDVADCVGAHHNGYNIGPSVRWDEVPDDPTAAYRGPFDNPHHSWSFRSTLEGYHEMIRAAGGDQSLCVTEFGWATSAGIDGFNVPGVEYVHDNTPEEQRDWILEALNNMRDWGFVRLAFLWNLNYGPQEGWDATSDNVPYSIIGPNWQHRPIWEPLGVWVRDHRAAIGR